LRSHFEGVKPFWVNLLESDVERRYAAHPERLFQEWKAQSEDIRKSKWIVIDEVQRIPRILDAVHRGIEDHGLRFALTGSSARKLRRGAANLLAGRASQFVLNPFSFVEIESDFNANDAMVWGLMPQSYLLRGDLVERRRYLNAYVNTYLREEIQAEQIIRNIEPFRQFIEVAASANGKILNASKIGRQCGIDPKTSQRYFEILADTLIGFYLPAFDLSIRKQQLAHPKFYWFDPGVARAASGLLDVEMLPGTYEFGNIFEQLVIAEAKKLNDATESHASLMYFRSADDAEIDLIVKKGRKHFAIEIKSSDQPDEVEIKRFARLCKSLPKGTSCWVLCNTKQPYFVDEVLVANWKIGLKNIFGLAPLDNFA
jgi:uncharacterized protein